ncbi:MAG: BlaI/MecI/CopY family transcriptional regulator [Eubacteriales bacterium]
MDDIRLGAVEARFAGIIWENEPVTTVQLIGICEKELKWKRTTTYTVLKRLCERGLFVNNGGVITSAMNKNDFNSAQSEKFVEERFNGSLPAFIAAFTAHRKLSDAEINEIRAMIEASRGEN